MNPLNPLVFKKLIEAVDGLVTSLATTYAALLALGGDITDVEADLLAIDYAVEVGDYATGKEDVLPSAANEKQATGGAGAWAYGSYTEIAPSIGLKAALVTGIHVTNLAGIHHVDLAVGAAASEVVIARIPVTASGRINIKPVKIPAASRLAVRTATKGGGAQTIDLFTTLRYIP